MSTVSSTLSTTMSGTNPKEVTLDRKGASGYSTKNEAHKAGMAEARELVRREGGCPTTCPDEKGKKSSCIRIAADDDINAAVKIFLYQATDRDHLYGWYLDGDVSTRCQCVENAK